MIQRTGEHTISLANDELQSFWNGYSTAPPEAPDTFVSTIARYNGEDGYADLQCLSSAVIGSLVPFYTALRAVTSLVPIASISHGTDWFQMFTARICTVFPITTSTAVLNVFITSDETTGIKLTLTPSASTLVYYGTTLDVTAAINSIVDTTTPFVTGALDVFIVGRRTSSAVIGVNAEYNMRVYVYKETPRLLCSFTQTLKTSDLYQAEFICKLG